MQSLFFLKHLRAYFKDRTFSERQPMKRFATTESKGALDTCRSVRRDGGFRGRMMCLTSKVGGRELEDANSQRARPNQRSHETCSQMVCRSNMAGKRIDVLLPRRLCVSASLCSSAFQIHHHTLTLK